MSVTSEEINNLINQDYKQGFVTELETDTFPPGLTEEVIHKLSKVKNEPEFMLEYRLKAFRHWQTMTSPEWAFVKFDPIDYQAISYYSAPKRKDSGPKSLDEIDPQVLEAYKKLVFRWMSKSGWRGLPLMRCLTVSPWPPLLRAS